MKTSHDPRHIERVKVMQELFSWRFDPLQKPTIEKSKGILKNLKKIDKLIEKSAPAWPLDKINKIDLAILRQAVYELTKEDIPPKVVVDEAVELGKEYGSQSSPSFINGVLGKLIDDLKISTS